MHLFQIRQIAIIGLSSLALLYLSCGDDNSSTSSNSDVSLGSWFYQFTEEDGDTSEAYLCLSSDESIYQVNIDYDSEDYYVDLYSGTYSLSSAGLYMNITTRNEYYGTEKPTDLTDFGDEESLGDDAITGTYTYSGSGDNMTIAGSSFTKVSSVPTYISQISCLE
ncbi:MAG TPA: hypothetical protein VLM37_04625 [Fibrobacteraceae bacterium]|nr:hypothetical protein [Fibrobacteraceae bacterium]